MGNIRNFKNEKHRMGTIIENYNKITNNTSVISSRTISAHIPLLTDSDFSRGYVLRFFIQKSNDTNAPIFEVASSEYKIFISNPLYSTTSLRWRLVGSLLPTDTGYGDLKDIGVLESNRISVKMASTTIPNLGMYLPNHQQFYVK